MRERLRWEKELIGLYLSEHPLDELRDQLPEYVTRYTTDLAEESDQAKVTLGGIVVGSRRLITRAGQAMLVVTLEDLHQSAVEVIVFPKVLAETAHAWAEGSILLVSGRVDRRDDQPSLLCEAVHLWDDAVRMGPAAFAAERDRLLRSRGPRGGGSNGHPGGNGNGHHAANGHEAVAVAVSAPAGDPVPVVKPRGAEEPVAAAVAAPALSGAAGEGEQPPPGDAVPLAARGSSHEGTVVVDFRGGVSEERLLAAVQAMRDELGRRGGSCAVVVNLPVAGVSRPIRLPDRVLWGDDLPAVLRRAAPGIELDVRLRVDE